jgi:hypothetical protein
MKANGPTVVEHEHPTVWRASFEGWPLRVAVLKNLRDKGGVYAALLE